MFSLIAFLIQLLWEFDNYDKFMFWKIFFFFSISVSLSLFKFFLIDFFFFFLIVFNFNRLPIYIESILLADVHESANWKMACILPDRSKTKGLLLNDFFFFFFACNWNCFPRQRDETKSRKPFFDEMSIYLFRFSLVLTIKIEKPFHKKNINLRYCYAYHHLLQPFFFFFFFNHFVPKKISCSHNQYFL